MDNKASTSTPDHFPDWWKKLTLYDLASDTSDTYSTLDSKASTSTSESDKDWWEDLTLYDLASDTSETYSTLQHRTPVISSCKLLHPNPRPDSTSNS